MEYPHDAADFSPFTKAYLELLRKQPLLEQPIGFLLEAIGDGMPAAGAALLHTLAHHSFRRAHLCWRELYYRGDDEAPELVGNLSDYNVADGAPNSFDGRKGILLGASMGGEVNFGIHWDRGDVRFFEVDLEDELGDPIKEFETADAFWDHVSASEYDCAEMEGEDASEFLVELYAAAGQELQWPQ